MNKKITSSVLAAVMIAGTTSFSAFAAMTSGTVVIGTKAFDLAYANDPAHAAEITNAVVAANGVIFVKDFEGNWIDNNTNAKVLASAIPAVTYKSATGVETKFDAMDKDTVSTLAVSSVSASSLNKVKVVFDKAVDTAKASFQIKRGAAQFASTVTWNADKTVATLETTISRLPAADYTVDISGLTEAPLVKAFTVLAETASKIEMVSTNVALQDNAKIEFKVSNQYGEAMSTPVSYVDLGAVSIYNVTKNVAITTANVAGKSEIILNDIETVESKVKDIIRVTVAYKGLTTQANLNVVEVATADAISLGSVILAKDDVRLNVSDETVQLSYTLLDQFGKEKKLTANKASAAAILAADGIQFVTSKSDVISGFTTDTDGKLVVTVAGSGTSIITAIVNKSGVISSATVTVEKNEEPTAAVINAPINIVAAADKEFDLGVVINDQYGTVVKSNSDLNVLLKSGNNAELNGATAIIASKGDKITVDVTGLTVTATRTATFEIIRISDSKVIGSVTFTVEPNAAVSYIQSINFGTKFEATASATLSVANVVSIDQYGRKITPSIVTIAKSAGADADVLTLEDLTITASSTAGTQSFKVNADGVEKTLKLDVVATTDVKSYALDEIATIYKSATTAYHVAPVLVGKTAAGDTVNLISGKVTSFTTSNPAIAKITSMKVEGVKAGEATITAWNGATQLASTKVTVSEAAPVATKVKFTTTTATIDNVEAIIEIKDQYGVEMETTGTVVGSTAAGTRVITFITQNGIVITETITFN
jgi:hypothetical protein